MHSLAGKRLLLGVTGGVAAYKSAELVRLLVARAAAVQVVMTANAQRFIGEATLQALSGQPVATGLWDHDAGGMGHLALARSTDLLLIAPATAQSLAKLAHGLADDLLSTLALATTTPVMVAPAMNQAMWSHPATQANLATLTARGLIVIPPGVGDQACGEYGPGRMAEPGEIVAAVGACLGPGVLAGRRVVITAGPTHEPLDPVRVLTNLSTGKMGYALAEAAREASASVVLVSGPTALTDPAGMEVVRVRTAEEMRSAVQQSLPADVFIATAAVADYRPSTPETRKHKKTDAQWSLALTRTDDILAEVARARPRPFTVGFAAETDALEANARAKLTGKALDLVVANQVTANGAPFGQDHNDIWVIDAEHAEHWPPDTKKALARRLVNEIAGRLSSAGTP